MNTYTPIGMGYEGGVHCLDCARRRFPELEGTDSEGNEIWAYTVHDAMESDSSTSCEDCYDILWEQDEQIVESPKQRRSAFVLVVGGAA